MDFFERQASAQRKTKLLVFYFVLAVISIIAVLQVIFSMILGVPLLDPELLVYVAGGVGIVVAGGSTFKIMELSQGGRVVAAMLGGEPLNQQTTNLDEKKLLNIVEEMAIASGVPVPEIYILPDATINAFAAGHGPGDTAIGVTRGCIEQLSRDELQGVIAHEFSHILHGDMKLNLRLIGILNGILCLALLGGILMRASLYARAGSRGRDDKGNSTAAIIAAGVALYLVGWIGVFFGNLIKAAVSRQREFLADASAVQFTRNPGGIAGALWKIGQFKSQLESPRAAEASHMFFGNGLGEQWLSMFATHPPLEERIQAIAPGFQPSASSTTPRQMTPPPLPQTPDTSAAGLERLLPAAALLLSGIPEFATGAVRGLHSAAAFVYALLLDEKEDLRAIQLQGLQVDEAMRREVLALFARRGEISIAQRLPLVDLAIPTLRHLSPDQYADFRRNIQHLIESDQEVHLFEFALQKTVTRHLDLYFTKGTGDSVKYRAIAPILADVGVLLSAMAYVGHPDIAGRDAAFAAGVRELLVNTPPRRDDTCDLAKVDAALDRVAQAAPSVKKTILTACRQVALHDGILDAPQYELIRAIADSMDCPLPPLPPVQA